MSAQAGLTRRIEGLKFRADEEVFETNQNSYLSDG